MRSLLLPEMVAWTSLLLDHELLEGGDAEFSSCEFLCLTQCQAQSRDLVNRDCLRTTIKMDSVITLVLWMRKVLPRDTLAVALWVNLCGKLERLWP